MITTRELRQKYMDFFASKNHAIIAGASLLPENDPTVLFTTAGMHPLIPYLMGEPHPAGQRLANCQKCIRTTDIEAVGDDVHLTYFEMLGNWSLGDYFKKEAIEYSWEFLTSPQWLGLNPDKLAISVFAGDKDAPRDDESAKIWLSLGLPKERVAYLDKQENWWGPAGQTGPCGPDTEMFYWSGQENPPVKFNPQDSRWVEIWNDVFMQYNKTQAGKYEPLKQKNVDTGMGLERTVAVLNGFTNVYEVDTIKPIYDKVRELASHHELSPKLEGDTASSSSLLNKGGALHSFPSFNKGDSRHSLPPLDKGGIKGGYDKSLRIITDNIRAAVMIMGDDRGVVPSNLDQGYVVRRLIRSAIRRGREIGINGSFITKVAEEVIKTNGDYYEELIRNKQKIISELTIEEEKFERTLADGLKELKKIIVKKKSELLATKIEKESDLYINVICGKDAFYIYSTYGFPFEMINEEVEEMTGGSYSVSKKEFDDEMKKHQQISALGANQKFSGGLADHSEEVKRLHTATHLLHAALRQVLGEHVAQKGSNITKDRLRFDFSHPDKMTPEQIKQVEDLVNEQIKKGLRVWWQEMTVEEAKKKGALGLFTQKYGEKVKVYTVGEGDNWFSRELCGGPHVDNTSELGKFKITKEQASSAGVRRIKAVLE